MSYPTEENEAFSIHSAPHFERASQESERPWWSRIRLWSRLCFTCHRIKMWWLVDVRGY